MRSATFPPIRVEPEVRAEVEAVLREGESLWAAAGSVDTDLSFSSQFELYRTDVPDGRVAPRRVVEALDVVEHV